jgi:hypothetical protein
MASFFDTEDGGAFLGPAEIETAEGAAPAGRKRTGMS